MRRFILAIGIVLTLTVTAGAIGMISFVNNTIPAGGFLLDGSAGFLRDGSSPGRILAR